jgi:hypothetical protein
MNDYKQRFEAWQKKASETVDQIDAQLGLRSKVEEGARVAADVAKSGADYVKSEAEKSDLGRRAVKVAEDVIAKADETAKTAWSVSAPVRDTAAGMAVDAVDRAGDFVGDAYSSVNSNARRAARVVSFGSSAATIMNAAANSARKAADWAKEDPARAATTGVSMAIGATLGVVFTGISSHWLLNSAIPTYAVKKLSVEFDGYLKRREDMIERGQLSEADAERIRFERDIAKRVGAPLLGAFAFASGAVMLSNVFNPAAVTGFPIGTIIGGNPVLEGIWFFGNGMVCLKTSYDFFMIALGDDADVETMVAEIRGMLPAAT